MYFLMFVLLGLCITPATARPSQTDDDDGQVREAEYEEGDGADEYIQDDTEALKSDNKRSYDDQAEKIDDYSEPDSEDPTVKSIQLVGDHKMNGRDDLIDDHNAADINEAGSREKNSNMHKRTSQTEVKESDATLKDKLYVNYRDQSRNKLDVKDKVIVNNEDISDKSSRESDSPSTDDKATIKLTNKRETFDNNKSDDKKNNKETSRKDLEDLLSSLSIDKVNVLKTLINDNIAKRDIAKKSNVVEGGKSSDDSWIDGRVDPESCHSSNQNQSEMPPNIHSLNTCPPSGGKLLKRDASKASHADASMELLEESFPKGYEKFNSDSDMEPLVRVKRTEGQKYLTDDSQEICQNTQNGEIGNINFATDKMSIGSDIDNILSNNEEVDSTFIYDKSRSKRAHDKTLVSDLHNSCETKLDHDRISVDNDKLSLREKEISSRDTELDGMESLTERTDLNRYKRIRQANDETD